MQLAFACYKYFPFGGLQRDMLRIALECQKRGHAIRVYTFSWQGEVPEGFEIVVVPRRGITSQGKNKYFTQWLFSHLDENPADLLVGFNKMPGLDVYYAADGCYEARVTDLYGRLYRLGSRYRHFAAYEKAVFGSASDTEILMISDVQKPVFQSFYKTPERRLHMLPPGISRDRCAPVNAAEIRSKFRHEFNIADDEYLLLMVGSGFKTKGLDRSLKAIKSLPDELKRKVHLFVLGQDKLDTFKLMSKSLGVDKNLTFFKGRDDVPRFLQGADLLIHPAYHENTGTVLLEAVVAGLPVLVSGICGYAHYVAEAEAGLVLQKPFQQNEFEQQLLNMLLSDDKPKWRANGLVFAERADIYSMPVHAADLIEKNYSDNIPETPGTRITVDVNGK